jgi:hypothetical protein
VEPRHPQKNEYRKTKHREKNPADGEPSSISTHGCSIRPHVARVPIGFKMMDRSLNASDQMAAAVATIKEQAIETNSSVKLIQQALESQGRAISDHGMRARSSAPTSPIGQP